MKRSKSSIGLAAVMLLIVAGFAIATPVEAYQLKVTSDNLATLQTFTYTYDGLMNGWYSYGVGQSPYLLKYDYGKNLNTYGKSKTAVWVGSMKAIKVGDGQCVDFAKAVSNTGNIASTSWRRGSRVMDGGVAQGTLIATFSGPYTYSGHVAVFDSYVLYAGPLIQNPIAGFRVWDENFVASSLVGMHKLFQSDKYLSNAYSYYVVEVQ